jgi:nitrous oxidase accessory protein
VTIQKREEGQQRSSGRVIAAVALLLLLAGAALPLWSMTLHAPQYPQGLRLTIDGRGAWGDVDELNSLNHYIGMSPIRVEEIPEIRLFAPGVAALALGVLAWGIVPWRVLRGLVLLGAWALPVAFLADLQWRLYQFGHSLDATAAFRLPAFTPRVLGPTTVMNFNVTAVPGAGLLLLVASALILTVGPRLRLGGRTRQRVLARAAAGVLLSMLSPAFPAAAGPAGFDLARAIASAPDGATIEVPPGRYAGPLVLARPVTLLGRNWPVIDGGGRGDAVVITGAEVRLEGFVIRGSALAYSREAAGVVVRGPRAVVRRNQVEDVLFGVYLAGADEAVIEANTIATAALPLERRGHAIYLWKAHRARLAGNRITRGKDGIYISFSDGNVVEGNTVTGCRYGVHYMYSNANTFRANTFRDNAVGAAVMYSTDVELTGNTFEGSRSTATGVGLIFKDADRLTVHGNRIIRNRIGLEFDHAPATADGWVRLRGNVIAFNGVGLSLMSTAAISASDNVIAENLRPVEPRGAVRAASNDWAPGGRGNYWSDYTGFDLAGDGVGDVPYQRADALEDLVARAPALQAFLFTPAHRAIETATRLMPLVRAAPVVVDPAPLMRPPAALRTPAPPVGGLSLLWASLGLLTAAFGGVVAIWPRAGWRRSRL